MLDFPNDVNTNPVDVTDRVPADMQTFMDGTLVRGSKAFHTGLMDPRNWFHLYDDFQIYTAANWSLTEIGAGGTEGVVDAANGILALVNDALNNDAVQIQLLNATVMFAAAKPVWFECRVSGSNTGLMGMFAGLCVTDTTVLAGHQDCAIFHKGPDTGDDLLDFVSDADATPTTVADVHTLVDGAYVNLAFGWDGVNQLVPYVNGVKQTVVTTNINDDTVMRVSFGSINDDGNARTMNVDYYDLWMLR